MRSTGQADNGIALEAGKYADLVVHATDPRRVPPSDIVNIKIERTMVRWEWVYES